MTGSNCCAFDWCHWYRIEDDGKLSRRFDINISVDAEQYNLNAKHESRPRVCDWDRDGIDDLVVVLHDNKLVPNPKGNPDFRTAWRVFVSEESAALPDRVRAGIETKLKRPRSYVPENAGVGSPPKGADVEVKLRAVVDRELEKIAADQLSKHSTEASFKKHFEIADYNGDGDFDLVFSDVRIESFNVVSSLYWMENLTSKGEPEFAPPVKIFQMPDKWKATSVAAVDLDSDKQLEFVASVYRDSDEGDLETQLWVLKAN